MVMTKDELYSELIEMRAEFQQQIEEMEESDRIDEPGTGYTNHQADDATAVYDQTVNQSTAQAVRNRLRQVEEALARYEAGTYGICENCGREIDLARLEAIPYTPYCLRCAETRDYNAGI